MTGKPFYFDANVFDKDNIEEEHDLPKPPEPKYTDDELETAKRKAFEEGRKNGFQDGAQSVVKDILKTVQKIDQTIPILLSKEEERNILFETEAVHLAYQILEKLFPIYFDQYGFDELKKIMKDTVLEQRNTPSLTIEIHENYIGEIQKYFEEMQSHVNKNISFKSNPMLQKFECHIKWSNGGAIIHQKQIADKIMTIMQEALAEHNITVHDNEGSRENSTSDNQETTGEL